MTKEPDFDPEAVIDAMAPLLGLAIAARFRPGIAANLLIIAGFAALLEGFALDEREEQAPVFTA